MTKVYLPATSAEDWRRLLARPEKHWKTGYSAKSLAYSWQNGEGFPASVQTVFSSSGIDLFQKAELLLAIPEYQVPLPGGRRASQNDIFVLATGNGQLLSIMVEGKVAESFGDTVADWKSPSTPGKCERLRYLCDLLELPEEQVEHIRYQLLHRTASAVIEARRFDAGHALMLVHSFGQSSEEGNESFQDYCEFLDLIGTKGEMDSLVSGRNLSGTNLYFAWVNGDKKYLES